jgi:predicted ATPase
MSRDPLAAAERSAEALKVSGEGEFGYWRPIASVSHGWALAQDTRTAEGIAQMEEGLAAYRAAGAGVSQPAFLGLLAETYGRARQPIKGLELLREAYAAVRRSGERWWEPELYRLEGELTLELADPHRTRVENEKHAEACFRQALEIAHGQSARLLELRAAVSLGRMLSSSGKRSEAQRLLEECYGWFTEGFTAPDLVEATKVIGSKPANRVA